MARTHGKDLNFSFNAVSLEDELHTVTINFTVPEAEISSFNDAWGNFLAGKPDTTIDLAGYFDGANGNGDDTLFAAFGAGPLTTVLDPTGQGPDTDEPTYDCDSSGLTGSILKNYHISLPVGGAAAYTATIQNSGLTTRNLS